MGLADLHVHTIYSFDGTASVPAVLQRARQVGLDVIAITDHDVVEGARLALDLAPVYGIEVIPGIEISTADGDLLALSVWERIAPGRSLIETVLAVRERGGVCIVPHPQARGLGMRSVAVPTLVKALLHPGVADTLVGVEAYNATALDRMGIATARLLTSGLNLASVGNSDAHVTAAIGLGATEFPGHTAADLLAALRARQTVAHRREEWSVFQILGSWLFGYLGSLSARLGMAIGLG